MNLLAPFGVAYGAAMQFRSWLYDRGLLSQYSLGRKTICVGNLTVGGTGKTPVTRHIAEIFANAGLRPCILTRGYGRREPSRRVVVSGPDGIIENSDISGDEPLELARELKEKAIIIADPDRVAAARFAIDQFAPDLFLLDDGFQHLRVTRDLNLLLIDATNPFDNDYPLPAGTLRECPRAIARADAILITRTEIAGDLQPLKDSIRRHNSRVPIFEAAFVIKGFRPLANRQALVNAAEIVGPKVLAFCGIANPKAFQLLLEKYSVRAAELLVFDDHQRYSASQIAAIRAAAKKIGADALITTEKDAVKLSGSDFSIPCYSARIEVAVSPEAAFHRLLLAF
ncbi:MAG: tetraacyldisaccharide 4'-kinase [Blastocatellia bacterium]